MEPKKYLKVTVTVVLGITLLGSAVFAGSYFTSRKQAVSVQQVKNEPAVLPVEVPVPEKVTATTTPSVTIAKPSPTAAEIKATEALKKAQAEINTLKTENVELNAAKVAADAEATLIKTEIIESLEFAIGSYIELKDTAENWGVTIDQIIDCVEANDNAEEIKYFKNTKNLIEGFESSLALYTNDLRARKITFEQKPLNFYYDFDYDAWDEAESELIEKNTTTFVEWTQTAQDGIDKNLKTCEQ